MQDNDSRHQKPHTSTIEWTYPDPRGWADRLTGPGTTRTELLLQLIPPLLIALALPLVAIIDGWGWSFCQMLIAAILGFDMLGGVITNATS